MRHVCVGLAGGCRSQRCPEHGQSRSRDRLSRGFDGVGRHDGNVLSGRATAASRSHSDDFSQRGEAASVLAPSGAGTAAARSDAEYEEATREVLDLAVGCRLRGRGDVGIVLSGGIDSSSIAATALDHGPVHTYSAVATDDESGRIRGHRPPCRRTSHKPDARGQVVRPRVVRGLRHRATRSRESVPQRRDAPEHLHGRCSGRAAVGADRSAGGRSRLNLAD